jgi:ATP-dependent Clp protease ATP-binding subunit ClpB
LKRAIQTELMDPLAMSLLSGEILDGQLVKVDVKPDGSGLIITTGTPPHLSMVPEPEED